MSFRHNSGLSASLGLLILRVGLGVVFLMHGWQKFDDWTVAGTAKNFSGMGIPSADAAAAFATYLELVGGVALILGLFSRLAGLLLGLEMLGAIYFVHGAAGFWAGNGGYEYVLVLALAGFAIFFTGPGRIALGGAFQNRRGLGLFA